MMIIGSSLLKLPITDAYLSKNIQYSDFLLSTVETGYARSAIINNRL